MPQPTLHPPAGHDAANPLSPILSRSAGGLSLLSRLAILALLFVAELLVISVLFDNAVLQSHAGLIGFIGQWGAWIVRGIVGFAVIFTTFTVLKYRPLVTGMSEAVHALPVRWRLIGAHAVAMASFGWLSQILYGAAAGTSTAALIAPLWVAAGLAGIVLCGLAFIPYSIWSRLILETGWLAFIALLAVVLACIAGLYSRMLWAPSAQLTFATVKAMLGLFASRIVADPATMNLGTARFSVEIAPECSGFEGAGLVLGFVSLWLWLFRRECRFPNALVLIPFGVISIYLLNATRITALILIGDAGAEGIALGGFHSQAGWIAFNAVALGICFAAQRISWITSGGPSAGVPTLTASANPTAPYLMPFVAILAAGMLTRAASADFDWLYPLRILAAASVLWAYKPAYRGLGWRCSWLGPAIGAAVFAMWIGIDLLMNPQSPESMPRALAAAPDGARITWLLFRVVGAILTVPLAEELAFRGFLLRRVQAEDFESVPLTRYTWLSLAVSSIAFGTLHGSLWLAGILCGLLYAWAQLRRGRIGDAVAAHMTTNALLAAYVLLFQKWHLW